MQLKVVKCVLLVDRHHGLTEAMRGLLETTFEAVAMVADEKSLLESVKRLQPTLAVVDLSLASSNTLRWRQSVRGNGPELKMFQWSVHDEPSVRRTALEAGADGFLVKREIAAELLPAIDAALAGHEPAGGTERKSKSAKMEGER